MGSAAATAETDSQSVPAAKAQALLLVQDFDYDATRKDSIAGAYSARTTLDVPADLGPQNKWVMFEGPVLENDRVAFRYYLDSRHRFDIYGKRVADLVMDTVSWDYHDVKDWGADILKVGNSLGAGTPAIYYRDQLHYLGDAESMSVESAGMEGDCARVLTRFAGITLDGVELPDITEALVLCPDDQSMLVRLAAADPGLPEGASFCAGVVEHGTGAQTVATGSGTGVYTWGAQSFHGGDLGIGLAASSREQPRVVQDELDHLLVFAPGDNTVDYRIVTGWELGVEPITTEEDFSALVRKTISRL